MSADAVTPIFDVPTAAKYLGVGPRVLRRLLKQGKIVHRKVDRRGTVRIHRDALDEYVKGGGQ